VGVDIEFIDHGMATDEMATRFFSQGEINTFHAMPPSEAYIEALGEGLSIPLDSFEAEIRPGAPAALLKEGVFPEDPSGWSMDTVTAHGICSSSCHRRQRAPAAAPAVGVAALEGEWNVSCLCVAVDGAIIGKANER